MWGLLMLSGSGQLGQGQTHPQPGMGLARGLGWLKCQVSVVLPLLSFKIKLLERQKQIEISYPTLWLTPQMPTKWPGYGQTEARDQELNLSLPHWWQGPSI